MTPNRPADPRRSFRSDTGSSSSLPLEALDGTEQKLVTGDGGDIGEARELMELLTDTIVQRILAAIDDDARPARELADLCDISRPTVYRKLDRLEALGLVVSRVETHQHGHHRKVFVSIFEEATIELVDGNPQITLVRAPDSRHEYSRRDPSRASPTDY